MFNYNIYRDMIRLKRGADVSRQVNGVMNSHVYSHIGIAGRHKIVPAQIYAVILYLFRYVKNGNWGKKLLPVVVSFFWYSQLHAQLENEFRLGVENISDTFMKNFGSKRVGLITNQTGVDREGRRTVDLLLEKGFAVSYLLAPEHGIDGTMGAGFLVPDTVDTKTGIPVVSLYGHGKGKKIPAHVLGSVDLIMFDIQDSGMRHYTYISTLLHVLKMAAQHTKPVVVFDRPNPLGAIMEGPVVESHLKSFISAAQIPLRHGMTVGELAWYFNKHELEQPADLYVIKMSNYERKYGLGASLGRPLSPGLRTMQACYGYSFLGLLGETGPFGIGLRTESRFQCIALPERIKMNSKVWEALQKKLNSCGVGSVLHSYRDPKSKTKFNGLRLIIEDINKVRSFEALYTVLGFFKSMDVQLSFSKDFDIAVGIDELRKFLAGEQKYEKFKETVNAGLKDFFEKSRTVLLYNSLPELVLMKEMAVY